MGCEGNNHNSPSHVASELDGLIVENDWVSYICFSSKS
jgi:hypothetical protein